MRCSVSFVLLGLNTSLSPRSLELMCGEIKNERKKNRDERKEEALSFALFLFSFLSSLFLSPRSLLLHISIQEKAQPRVEAISVQYCV